MGRLIDSLQQYRLTENEKIEQPENMEEVSNTQNCKKGYVLMRFNPLTYEIGDFNGLKRIR